MMASKRRRPRSSVRMNDSSHSTMGSPTRTSWIPGLRTAIGLLKVRFPEAPVRVDAIDLAESSEACRRAWCTQRPRVGRELSGASDSAQTCDRSAGRRVYEVFPSPLRSPLPHGEFVGTESISTGVRLQFLEQFDLHLLLCEAAPPNPPRRRRRRMPSTTRLAVRNDSRPANGHCRVATDDWKTPEAA